MFEDRSPATHVKEESEPGSVFIASGSPPRDRSWSTGIAQRKAQVAPTNRGLRTLLWWSCYEATPSVMGTPRAEPSVASEDCWDPTPT